MQIDTRDILFICGGAFVGLADIVAQRLGARESGFGAAWHDHEVPKRELLAQVSADDLADFGLLPEFIGRLPVVSVLEELTEEIWPESSSNRKTRWSSSTRSYSPSMG